MEVKKKANLLMENLYSIKNLKGIEINFISK